MHDRKGFTLIELLVVIAIIALLLAIIIPALNSVKQLAAQVPCMQNQRTIAQAFFMYQEDHDGWLVTGHAWFTPNSSVTDGRDWTYCPMTDNGAPVRGVSENPTAEFEKNGIRAGALWPYIEAIDSYHCPADRRVVKDGIGWRSYSMVAGLGAAYGGYVTEAHEVHKMHEIKSPGDKYISVEEIEKLSDGRYWWNMGSWVVDIPRQYWFDPVAGWHTWGCTLAFADSHSEKIKWRDQRTKDWIQGNAQKGSPSIDQSGNVDMAYIVQHFTYKR